LLTISVGQEAHEKEKFSSTIDLVNKSFKSCVLGVNDILQRHTMALYSNKSADDFYDISVLEGNAWLIRNEEFYSKFTIPVEIVRWDKWLFHPELENKKKFILKAINDDLEYRSSFSVTIDEFLRRFSNRSEVGKDKMRYMHQVCLDYLVEECAAMCLWVDMECHFDIYPSKRNPAMQATHERFILPYYPDLLHPVAIKFKSRRDVKPQIFTCIINDK
jgi:hypothetical protein